MWQWLPSVTYINYDHHYHRHEDLDYDYHRHNDYDHDYHHHDYHGHDYHGHDEQVRLWLPGRWSW